MLYNRDLSWLGFNFRVLHEASDKSVPLFERMRFLSIFSSNLDEFFRVRYPAIIALSRLKEKTRKDAGAGITEDLGEKVQQEVNRQLDFFGHVLTQEIIPELEKNGIIFYYDMPVRTEHQREIRELFMADVLSFIQPVMLEEGRSSNFMPGNNQLYFVVTLKEPAPGVLKHAVVNIPSGHVKRFFQLTQLEGNDYIIFLDDVIRENLQFIFPSKEIISVYSFKFNRDAELNLSDEYSGNLLNKIEKQLKKRDTGLPSRFLFEHSMPRNLQLFLAAAFAVKFEDMFAGGRYHHLSDLSGFPVADEKFFFKKIPPISVPHILDNGNVFEMLEHQDILLHLPYQSYNPVLAFFNQAAVDEEVTDIYITLYRLAADSHIVHALISAAKNGKHVVVFIELKARFDEANNIKWSRIMKEAGIKLQYSMPQIKVHSKIALVRKKREGHELCYAVLSTGNFNEVTARFYTDHVLMTSNVPIMTELHQLFAFLQKGRHDPAGTKIKFSELLVSQFNMKTELEKRIGQEIKKAKEGLPARIRIKVNNLEEPEMISLLYKAAKAGVQVDLIVRSVCCIIPGTETENLTVRRIVDRFLEHTRLYIFGTGDDAIVLMGSADLMIRNLHHRIEVCVPVRDPGCRKELLDYFDMQWTDSTKAVQLLPDHQYKPVKPVNGELVNAQQSIYQYLKEKL